MVAPTAPTKATHGTTGKMTGTASHQSQPTAWKQRSQCQLRMSTPRPLSPRAPRHCHPPPPTEHQAHLPHNLTAMLRPAERRSLLCLPPCPSQRYPLTRDQRLPSIMAIGLSSQSKRHNPRGTKHRRGQRSKLQHSSSTRSRRRYRSRSTWEGGNRTEASRLR